MNVPLFVLAGGRATRLGPLADEIPKYLMPVKGSLSFADVHLEWAKAQGFQTIILSLGHLAEKVRAHCGSGEKWGLDIHYVYDGEKPLGTGGATKKSLQFNFEYLGVTYGDTILDFDVAECIRQTIETNAAGCMTVFENHLSGHVCNADLRQGHLVYDKKNPGSDWKFIDYGFSVLRRDTIQGFTDQTPLDLAEPLSALSKTGGLLGYVCKNRFWEIGSVEALEAFRGR